MECVRKPVCRNLIAVCHSILQLILVNPHQPFQHMIGNRIFCILHLLRRINMPKIYRIIIDIAQHFLLILIGPNSTRKQSASQDHPLSGWLVLPL